MYGFLQGVWFDILIGVQCSCTQRLAWATGEQTAGNQGTAETTAGEGDSNPGENHDYSGSGEGGKNYHTIQHVLIFLGMQTVLGVFSK